MIFYEVTWETSSILKSIVSFINVSARPGILLAFCSPRLSFHDNVFVSRHFFSRARKFDLIHFSRTFKWPFTLQQDVIFSNAPLFSTTAYPLNVDKFAIPARKGWGERFLVFRNECTSNGNYWNDWQVLAPYPSYPISSFPFSCFRHSSRIAPPRYCAHKRITTYTSAHKILCMFASIVKVLWRFDSDMF